jgi:hypothetical protein
MFVRHNNAGVPGATATYTLFVNNIITALSVTISTGVVGQASNLVDVVNVSAGDFLGLVVNSTSGGIVNSVDAKISVQFGP